VASIKETMKIIEMTPNDQPIMLEGIHGIGKSECVKEHFEKLGYRVVILFLGQMSDAGDILGLPDRQEIEVDGVKSKVTNFCPPAWWPQNMDEKVIIFLDELNRAKPELHQVIMDMVLNRRLYNRPLPTNTQIIAAINPLDDGYYQVEEMDPALIDRFNKYEFKPTVDEWLDWALEKKVNRNIMGFVSRNNDLLDPPSSKEYRVGKVYPSRRSWKKISDILNENPDALSSLDNFKTMMLGIVGDRATSAFGKYLKEVGTGIHAGKLLTEYDDKIEATLLTMNVQDFIHLNRQIIMWFSENEKILAKNSKGNNAKITYNLQKYLETIPAETMAQFYGLLAEENRDNKTWPKLLMSINPSLGLKMIDMMNGEENKKEDPEADEYPQDNEM